MMRSMTCFGVGVVVLGTGRVAVELRSDNHRFSDVRVRLRPELSDSSFFVEQIGRKPLGRGRFDASARILGDVFAMPVLAFERARTLYRMLCGLRGELNPSSEVSITGLLNAPGLFSNSDSAHDDRLRHAIETAFLSAVENLNSLRSCEGSCLSRQLCAYVEHARRLADDCCARAELAAPAYRLKLQERLNRLLTDSQYQLDETRLQQQDAHIAVRSDVTEEVARLASHFDQFVQLLDSSDKVRRCLDFLLQEVGRETTIGAKSQDSELSRLVVELKAEVEKIREQDQNVE